MSTTAEAVRTAPAPVTGGLILRLSGELDVLTASELIPSLLGLAGEGDHELVLDLSAVGFCDSSGANAFLQVNRRLAAGTRLLLRGVSRQPAKVLRLLGLHRTVPCDFAPPARP
ncbi:STAS domain-containing protein [Kitasatospora sp. A2-31]|uniref:STAS domain-containing protein n=1 Tax=Kitasatospora sp. A2-31 TaxID=2916414 RepID=UPI001EEA4C0C|nr:STAS domain-containing protein [Kitasatospora sp. A2-31]MCG6498428.1 STAS domain-containing protein [Kitasatospora sp. A2-31]